MIKYGLISEVDAKVIEKTLNRIIMPPSMSDEYIYTLEIGIFDGQTSRAINEYVLSQGKKNVHTAIDNNKDKEVLLPFEGCNLMIGNSSEVYNLYPDNMFHFGFIDGNHSFPMVVSDFFCWKDKIKKDGYMAFHDTGRHIKRMTDYQRIGSETDEDMYISVRKALNKIGLLNDDKDLSKPPFPGWQLIYDEADGNDLAGGVCVFKKLY